MDSTDLVLSMLLMENSRRSYQELADTLGLSVNAVHRRIQSLIALGIIRKFTAKISLTSLQVTTVFIFGNSKAEAPHKLAKTLSENGSIYWVAYPGGNYLHIGAYIRNLNELNALTDFLKREAGMQDPTIGIIGTSETPPFSGAGDTILYPLDYRIIHSLRDDSRKPISEVADEVGVSAKTARLRLSRMIKHQLIDLSLEWYPDASNDIIALFHVHLKPSAEKNDADRLSKKYAPNIIFYWSFSNLPNNLIMAAWTDTMKKMRDLQSHLESEEIIDSIAPNILYYGYMFDTWRDKLLTSKISQSERKT